MKRMLIYATIAFAMAACNSANTSTAFGTQPTEQDLRTFLDKTVARPAQDDRGNAKVTYELKSFRVGVQRKWSDVNDKGHPANGENTPAWVVYATYVETTHYVWKTRSTEHVIIYDAFKEDTGNWYFSQTDDPGQSERSWEGASDL